MKTPAVSSVVDKRTNDAVFASVREHRSWVEAYLDMTREAAAGYPAPLTQDQKDVYGLLPDLIDRCAEAYLQIPEALRPVHYLRV